MKKIILALLLISNSVYGQTLLEHTFNHSLNFGITDMLDLEDGNLLFTANAQPQNSDSILALVLKTDTAFNIQWVKRYKAFARDNFSIIRQANDGNFFLGGVMKQQFISQSGSSIYKIDPQGNVMWRKVYSRTADDRILEIFEQGDGSLMLFVRHGVTNQPTKIIHTDSVGNMISQRTYKIGNDGVKAEDVTTDNNGVFYMGGPWRDAQNNFYGFFITAVDESGLLWHKRYSLSRTSSVYSLDFTTDGFIIASGYLRDTTTAFEFHPVILKFDPTGNLVWGKEYREIGGNSANFFRPFAIDNGEMYVSGYVMDGINRNGLLAKLNTNGDLLWSNAYRKFTYHSIGEVRELFDDRLLLNSGANNAPYMLITTSEGISACSRDSISFANSSITVTDTSITPIVIDPMVIENIPAITIGTTILSDSALCATAVSVQEIEKDLQVELYPNPSDLQLVVSADVDLYEVDGVYAVNILGSRIVPPYTVSGSELIVDISSLSGGVYTLLIQINEQRISKKFVKW